MTLASKNMKYVGAKIPSSPDEFARLLKENIINFNKIGSDINVEMVKYEQWKRVKMLNGKRVQRS